MANSLSVYADIDLSTDVMSASPHRLIQLLFGKFVQHTQLAKQAISSNNRANRNHHITKANDIIVYLRACLKYDDENIKKFSSQLDSSYALIQKCLINATLKDDGEYLELASQMMTTIKSGWDQIG